MEGNALDEVKATLDDLNLHHIEVEGIILLSLRAKPHGYDLLIRENQCPHVLAPSSQKEETIR